jgi:spermidine synthase
MASVALTTPSRLTAPRPLFVAAIFAGSFLLFLIQPMVARMALPRLGGAPAVWNSAMLVYQALLLGGYAYAHAIGRLPQRQQVLIHLAVLAVAALWLPLGLAATAPPADANPTLWVPWLLAISIGPLFFAISAQAPLMQRWFAMSRPGRDPYPLYAASNLGSFGGLLAYPLLVEPGLTLAQQSLIWTAGYGVVVLLVGSVALGTNSAATGAAPATLRDAPSAGRPSGRELALWILLSAIPSGLILATTTHLTTDIVAMPLIWVIPLGLYLLSFSISFSDRGIVAAAIERGFALVIVVAAGLVSFAGVLNPLLAGAVDLLLLFVVSVTLHRELYRRRPDPSRLTGFYLAMSFGGVVGGAFCALVAPVVFDWVYEYPALILLAGIAAPRATLPADLRPTARRRRWTCVAALLLSLVAGDLLIPGLAQPVRLVALAALAILTRSIAADRIGFGLCLVALMLGVGGWQTVATSATEGARERSYFGVYSVTHTATAQVLTHGTTVHGIQLRAPGRERMATSYYGPNSGVGLAMVAAPRLFGPAARIGVVGLGAGTLACYAQPGQNWRFYEIDPAIAEIARDPRRFTFLSRCLPSAPIRIGDARLTLAGEREAPLDLLVVDAFSSDAVPAHLLTLEAMEIYRRRLAPGGLLMVHISNRFMDLRPVIAAAAANGGWTARLRDDQPGSAGRATYQSASTWIALAEDRATIARLVGASSTPWQPLTGRAGFSPWTDDYGSILPILKIGH